jgi:hypothetical protein
MDDSRLKRCRACGACSEKMDKCPICKDRFKLKWSAASESHLNSSRMYFIFSNLLHSITDFLFSKYLLLVHRNFFCHWYNFLIFDVALHKYLHILSEFVLTLLLHSSGTIAASHAKFQTGHATRIIISRSRKRLTIRTVCMCSMHYLVLLHCTTMVPWASLSQPQKRQKTPTA